jgi:CHAT domain-containing protein
MTKDFLGDVEIRRQLTNQQETFDKDLLQQGRFHPRIPSDVLALEQFTLARLNLPTGAPEQVMSQLLGAFAQSLNLPSRSSEQMQQWEALGGTLGDARSHYLQGTVLEGQGQDDAALAAFLKAVELLEANRSTLPDEKSRGTFLEDKINFYYKPILHLLDRRRLGDAFELLERSRSRAMADLLASNPPSLRQSKDRDLYAKLRTLEVNIALREQELFIDRAKPDPARLAARIAGNEQEIQRLEAEHRRLLARIAEEAPKLRQLTVSAPMSLEQLQHSMRQEGYEVLQYLALETTIIVWHIRSDAVQVKSVFLPKSELIKKVAKLRNSLDRPERFDEQTARELYLFLIQPVLSGIRGEHLVIIPHEDLYYIPFQVLQDPSDGTYIGERFRISYAPSATILLGLNKAGSLAGEKLLAVADPSIGQAQQEVTAIARMYPGGHKVVSDALVRETDIKAWVADYNVLHLSVHGEFTPQEPLLSHLKLAEGGQDDGKLTAAEMFGLPLEGVRLAVLSACETGQAEATHANEVLGMMRALLYAGANTLILSSWRVDAASTALWMEAFYQEAQTRPVSEAARLALEVVKRHPRYGHPYYWGPFVMIGK